MSFESHNRMTSYNIAVTVSPNIFRPEEPEMEDFSNVGIFYGAMIMMIDHCDLIFNENITARGMMDQMAAQNM